MNTRAAYSEAYALASILQNQIAQSKEGSVFSDKNIRTSFLKLVSFLNISFR